MGARDYITWNHHNQWPHNQIIFRHSNINTQTQNMKVFILLSLAVLASAKPSEHYEPAVQIISEGPWVTDNAWAADEDNRDPKGILDSVPSPTAILGRLGSWWDWDR